MEYHDQPLNFINNHYLEIKDRSAGEYPTITLLISLPAQIYLFGMPIVAYLTTQYIYPKICYFMEQYTKYLVLNDGSFIPLLFLYLFPISISFFFKLLLIIAQIISIDEFVNYGNEVLHDDDLYHTYIHVACSSLATVTLFAIAIGNIVWNKHDFISRLSLFISLDVIYIIGYFSPFMLLAFIHDPLVTTLTYFIVVFLVVFLICACFLLGKEMEKAVFSLHEMLYFCLHAFKLLGLILSIFYVMMLLVQFVSATSELGSFNDFQSLQTLLLSLLVGLVSFYVVKPTYKQVCKHANLITNASDEEGSTEQEVNSNTQTNNDCTGNNETEEMALDNQNGEDTMV